MLKRLSFMQRVLLIISPIVLGLILTSGWIVNISLNNWRQTEGLRESIDFFTDGSALIHELQKERGRSVLFLGKKIILSELKKTREFTEQKIADFDIELAKADDTTIKVVANYKATISGLRQTTESGGPVPTILAGYSDLIAMIMKAQLQRAQAYHFQGLESQLTSYLLIEEAKENMGKLRAKLSGILGEDKPVGMDSVAAITELWTGIMVSLNSPALIISGEQKQKVAAIKGSPAWVLVEKSYGAMVQKAAEGRYGISATEFFSSMTTLIDNLNRVHHENLFNLRGTIQEIEKKEQRKFYVISVAFAALIVGIIFALIRLLNDISEVLSKVVKNLSGEAQNISVASRDLDEYSRNLNSTIGSQNLALGQTLQSLEEVKTMVASSSDNAGGAKEAAVASSESAQSGQIVVQDMMKSIAQIQESNEAINIQVKESNRELSEILKVISEIGSKTKVINDIVFQTKLLSFNASVEAARAGEHGKGFSVVAEEIGNLAKMSGHASTEINKLLEGSVAKVHDIVETTQQRVEGLIEQAKETIRNGYATAEKVVFVLEDINSNLAGMKTLAEDISRASTEQTQGVGEIVEAMHLIDKGMVIISEVAGQTSDSAELLGGQSKRLEDSVRNLVVLVGGVDAI